MSCGKTTVHTFLQLQFFNFGYFFLNFARLIGKLH